MGRKKKNDVVAVPEVAVEVVVDAAEVAVVEPEPEVALEEATPPPTVAVELAPGACATVEDYDLAVAEVSDEAARAELALPGSRAIAAGLLAVRATLANPDAIREAVPVFTAAALGVCPSLGGERATVSAWSARNITTGQNLIYAIAHLVRVADPAIATAWCACWPNAKCDYAAKHAYVRSTRTDLGNARHGWTREDLARFTGDRRLSGYTVNGLAR